jgi:hypothetical protein
MNSTPTVEELSSIIRDMETELSAAADYLDDYVSDRDIAKPLIVPVVHYIKESARYIEEFETDDNKDKAYASMIKAIEDFTAEEDEE